MPRPGALLYLQKNVGSANFFADWKALDSKTQDDLKSWAEEEMTALGMVK